MTNPFRQNDKKLQNIRTIFYSIIIILGVAVTVGFLLLLTSNAITRGLVCLIGGWLCILTVCILFELITVFLTDVKFIRNELHKRNCMSDGNVGKILQESDEKKPENGEKTKTQP